MFPTSSAPFSPASQQIFHINVGKCGQPPPRNTDRAPRAAPKDDSICQMNRCNNTIRPRVRPDRPRPPRSSSWASGDHPRRSAAHAARLQPGRGVHPFPNALFTATSATCVTGLVRPRHRHLLVPLRPPGPSGPDPDRRHGGWSQWLWPVHVLRPENRPAAALGDAGSPSPPPGGGSYA